MYLPIHLHILLPNSLGLWIAVTFGSIFDTLLCFNQNTRRLLDVLWNVSRKRCFQPLSKFISL